MVSNGLTKQCVVGDGDDVEGKVIPVSYFSWEEGMQVRHGRAGILGNFVRGIQSERDVKS